MHSSYDCMFPGSVKWYRCRRGNACKSRWFVQFYRRACGSDGMTIDERGNIYLTGDGVTVFDKDGQQIAHFPIPEDWTANVCFGGKERNILFITASKSVYTLKMLVHGVQWWAIKPIFKQAWWLSLLHPLEIFQIKFGILLTYSYLCNVILERVNVKVEA